MNEEKYIKSFNGEKIFCLEYDKETLKDMVLDLQQRVEQLEKKSEILEENNQLLIHQKQQMYDDLDKISDEKEQLENIIKDLLKDIEIISECEDIHIIKMQLRSCLYNKIKELNIRSEES